MSMRARRQSAAARRRRRDQVTQAETVVRSLGRPATKVLLRKLAPLLQVLTAEERVSITAADKALLRHPGGIRGALTLRPSQPIEVVLPRISGKRVNGKRVGGALIGALFLRRDWLERAFAASDANGSAGQESAASERTSAISEWFNDYGWQLGRLLHEEITLLEVQLQMRTPDHCLDILENYAAHWPTLLHRIWALPRTQFFLPFIGHGDRETRRRLRHLEKQRLTHAKGRPKADPQSSKATVTAQHVKIAEAWLAPFFEIWNERRSLSRLEEVSSQLRAMDASPKVIEAILGNPGNPEMKRPCRLLRSAACRLIALQTGQSFSTVDIAARRGWRYV